MRQHPGRFFAFDRHGTAEQRGPTDNCTDTATDFTDLFRECDGSMPNEPEFYLLERPLGRLIEAS